MTSDVPHDLYLMYVGNFDILETLFTMKKRLPVVYSDLDPDSQNEHGYSLFHKAALAKFSGVSMKAVELLYQYEVL